VQPAAGLRDGGLAVAGLSRPRLSGRGLFSPEFDYAVYDATDLARHLATINRLLAAKGFAPMTLADITPAVAQMRAMVDLLHVYGIAVCFDVVYNHAGGWAQTYAVPKSVAPSACCMATTRVSTSGTCHHHRRERQLGQQPEPLLHQSGLCRRPLVCAVEPGRSGFLCNNALGHLQELHADGFRYDEISMLLAMNNASGWSFARS